MKCPNCGAHVRVGGGGGTGALLAAMIMILVVGAGGTIAYRNYKANTTHDTAVIGSHLGEIGR